MVKMEGDTCVHYNLNHILCSLTTIFYISMDKVVVSVYGQEAWGLNDIWRKQAESPFLSNTSCSCLTCPLFVNFSEDDGRRSVNDMRDGGLKSTNCGEINSRRKCFLKESPHIQPEFNALPLLCISDTLWLCLVNMCTWTFLHNVLLS